MVKFGCWHTVWPTDIYVNIGKLYGDYDNDDNDVFMIFIIGKYRYFHDKDQTSMYLLNKVTVDKFFCEAALNLNLTSFISTLIPQLDHWYYMYDMLFHEITICTNNCSSITYNNTCAPIIYRYGPNAEHICHNCNDSIWHLNCGSGNNQFIPIPNEISDDNYQVRNCYRCNYYMMII